MNHDDIIRIVKRAVRGEIIRTLDPDEWKQEAIVGYEEARRLYPDDEKEQLFGAISAVQRYARREHKARKSATITDDTVTLESGMPRLSPSFSEDERKLFYQVLDESDDTTKKVMEHILNGRSQLEASRRVGIPHVRAHRCVMRFIERARNRRKG